MKRKKMAWLLSGIMMLQPVAGVQAAEFSDEVVGYFSEEENDTEENVRFYGNNLRDYTLKQMSEKGNKLLQEALPPFESCLKQGYSGVTMKDLGFNEYYAFKAVG